MEQTVTIRFRWTADELLRAHCYHFRHMCRPVFRFGLHLLFAVILLGGVMMLFTSGPSGKAPLPVTIGFLIVGSYWFAVRPFEHRWWTRRQFNKRADRDLEIEWQVGSDKILARSALAQSEITWQAFTKMVRTPGGVMLYPNDQMYHWLPRHGFVSDAEFERFVELAKSRIERYYDVA
jgi:YcxB-like protein